MTLPLQGNLKNITLVKLLVELNRERKTGTLSVEAASVIRKVYIQDGDAIFASSTNPDERLGEMLLKAGKITVEQYDKSVEILKKTKKRQGAILVEQGYLTPKELFWGVKYQVKEIIQSLFTLEDAEYAFEEGDVPSQEVITLKMSLGNIIYAGVNRIVNWTRIRNEMPHTDSVLALSGDPLKLFQDIELSAQDKKILSLIDGKSTIKQIIDSSWMGSFDALKILYVLWSIGMIEEATAENGAPGIEESVSLQDVLKPLTEEEESLLKKVETIYDKLETARYDDLLEVGENADPETIKKNYYRLAKEFHPDRYFSSADASVKKKLTAIFDAISKAYGTLKDEKKRAEYYRSLGAPQQKDAGDAARAEEQFKSGVAEFKKNNFWGAIENFKWATKLLPKSANYWNYLSLAYSRVPGRLKDAEEAMLTALKLEPANADFQANLGLVYLKAGLKKRAQGAFEKALKLDPKNEKAKKGIEQA